MRMKKPEMEVTRFEDRDVIATSGYSPNGQLMTEFAKTVDPSQLFSAMRYEYNEMRANSGSTSTSAVWVYATAKNMLIPSISKASNDTGYNNRDNWIYIWWDNTDKSWRTDGQFLSYYSKDAAAYRPGSDSLVAPTNQLWIDAWPTN
ncbi:MAG: hypothetical protein Q4A32_11335 [Lachnospiraceae bacterium]|nr:hypothetical protein [Lachnospiraceae bacterium]